MPRPDSPTLLFPRHHGRTGRCATSAVHQETSADAEDGSLGGKLGACRQGILVTGTLCPGDRPSTLSDPRCQLHQRGRQTMGASGGSASRSHQRWCARSSTRYSREYRKPDSSNGSFLRSPSTSHPVHRTGHMTLVDGSDDGFIRQPRTPWIPIATRVCSISS